MRIQKLHFSIFFPFAESPLHLLKAKLQTSEFLLRLALSHPNLVKHPDFKVAVKDSISQSQTHTYSKPDLFVIRLLLTYSKFTNADFNWKHTITKSLRNFNERELNIWDLGLIMSLYYDALRRFHEIKGRENDFFNDRKTLFLKETEYNTAMCMSLANLREFLRVWRGKHVDGKLFFECVLDRFFEQVPAEIDPTDQGFDALLFFGKLFIGFEFRNERFEGLMREIFRKKIDEISMNDWTDIYMASFRKLNFDYPEFFPRFLEKIKEKINQADKIEVTSNIQPHHFFLPIDYLQGFLEHPVEISPCLIKSKSHLSNRNLLDVYWMLTRNYDPKNKEILALLSRKLLELKGTFFLRDLVFLLISLIYHRVQEKSPVNFDEYKDILTQIAEKIDGSDENAWEILNVKSISGSLFQSLKYLMYSGYSETIEEIIGEDTLLFLGRQWLSATRARKTSNSEKLIRESLKGIMYKLDRKKVVKFGSLLGELYYCDIVIGQRYVVEINGAQHYNVFYRSGGLADERYKYLSNFELKKAILWTKGYNVFPLDEEKYSKIRDDKVKLEEFLLNYLKNILNL